MFETMCCSVDAYRLKNVWVMQNITSSDGLTPKNCRPAGLFPLGIIEAEVKLRPMVSRPDRLGVGHPSGAHNQIFVFINYSLTIMGFLTWGALSDERIGL
jgi:hypothetical protein